MMVDAKAGLKRALEKANYLEKDNFKLLKYWLKNDEDTSADTVRFFERMRKEIKRSLKVTGDTIKHPDNLGARRREKSTVQIYPSLPSTVEVTEEDSTLKWVNNSKTEAKDKRRNVITQNPPDYEQSEETQKNTANTVHPGGSNQHMSHDLY